MNTQQTVQVDTERVEHKKLLDRMLVLSTKLNVIESDNRPKCLLYSNELIWRVRGEILNTLNSITSQISRNLQQQSNSFICLRQFHEEFIITSKGVDWNDQSRLCNGSATEKPLIYYVDHSIDIMYCLHIYEQAIQFNKSHIDVRDSSSIARLANSVSIPQNFNDRIIDVLLNSCFVDKTEKVRNKS
ncbi:uncharacterized protein LOC119069062 isoform X2 [Bradysia coprophila]|uniref:uncharacterized protein LOC119069062 isoform X2 n=1 Tax=Bradysia coprophila TaxID=38358 RepID=UPI00187DCD9F|nr:uncharacterized protein LOC119069062 isoform X2 [Bradysia coprophila]